MAIVFDPAFPKRAQEAKRLIVAILSEAGGVFKGKTLLYKTFYRAHLEYWEHHTGRLSDYPIVCMPQGPGIDQGDDLLSELRQEGIISMEKVPKGDYHEYHFSVLRPESVQATESERDAIRRALVWIGGRWAKHVSDETHRTSRTWKVAKESGNLGAELDIYLDLIPDDKYARIGKAIASERSQLEALLQREN